MTESKKSQPPQGDFIDLEKGQYKKNFNLKKYLLIILILLISLLSLFVYFHYSTFKSFFAFNDNIKNDFELLIEPTSSINTEEQINLVRKEQLSLIQSKIEELTKEIFDNKIKLSKADETISDLREQIKNYEMRNIRNSDFFYAEKYIILNDLLNLKNKFKKRQDIKRELDNLVSRFNDKPEIKSIIIFLQELKIEEVSRVDDLLEKINKKIDFYELDIDKFINTNFKDSFKDNNEIFDSKESFISYLKNLINSTYKITKVNDQSTADVDVEGKDYNFLKTLIKAKEYLIIDNIKKATQILSQSDFGDYEINVWIDDALILLNTREKLETLESMLLENIGEHVN